jgi:hypothetical protein
MFEPNQTVVCIDAEFHWPWYADIEPDDRLVKGQSYTVANSHIDPDYDVSVVFLNEIQNYAWEHQDGKWIPTREVGFAADRFVTEGIYSLTQSKASVTA